MAEVPCSVHHDTPEVSWEAHHWAARPWCKPKNNDKEAWLAYLLHAKTVHSKKLFCLPWLPYHWFLSILLPGSEWSVMPLYDAKCTIAIHFWVVWEVVPYGIILSWITLHAVGIPELQHLERGVHLPNLQGTYLLLSNSSKTFSYLWRFKSILLYSSKYSAFFSMWSWKDSQLSRSTETWNGITDSRASFLVVKW